MRRRVSAATGPGPLSTRDTLAIDTPALRATSLIEALIAVRERQAERKLCTKAAPGRMSTARCKRLQSRTVTAPSRGCQGIAACNFSLQCLYKETATNRATHGGPHAPNPPPASPHYFPARRAGLRLSRPRCAVHQP